MEEQGKRAGTGRGKLLAGLLAASLALNVGLGVLGVKLYRTARDAAQAAEDAAENTATTEDNVTIDGQYVIRSTTAISDAYLSGDASGLNDEEQETLTMASEVLEQIITDGMSDYEKEMAVYDWMCANLETDEGVMTVVSTTVEGVDTPYGVLKNHKAICVGYATTFRLFMQMMGIECMVVHSTELMHSWDLVKIGGHWYHVDIYSDVGTGNYATFNLNDEMMLANDEDAEQWDTSFFPAADSVEYTYLYQNSETATGDVYELASRLRAALDAGETTVALRYDTALSDEDKQAVNEIINQVSMLVMTNSMSSNSETYLTGSVTDIDGGAFVLVSIITYEYDEEDWGWEEESTLSDEVQEKVDAAISEAFPDYARTASGEITGTASAEDTASTEDTEDAEDTEDTQDTEDAAASGTDS